MADYILSCCSTTDLSPEQFKSHGIERICFHYSIDGKEYLDDGGVPLPDFFDAMKNGAVPKTSQVPVGEFLPYFRSFLEQGKDILHISLSSGLSGAYQSACIARDELALQFPDRKIYIIDSLCGSGGAAILMLELADRRDRGLSVDSARSWVETHKLQMHHWLFTPELAYFVRGGRISPAAGWLGTLLKLCPLIEANAEGKLLPNTKIRGKLRAMTALIDKMKQHAQGGLNYAGPCRISHANCAEDAYAVKALIEEQFANLREKIGVSMMGTTLGSHCGPGTVAIFFFGAQRQLSAM
ncbi:MAG: DegV family protein [Oscillospiraceae bacterium]|jgi:DegV family protein with EDD domain|nr:DegV family protein [Oscillospiraceae bacterium]